MVVSEPGRGRHLPGAQSQGPALPSSHAVGITNPQPPSCAVTPPPSGALWFSPRANPSICSYLLQWGGPLAGRSPTLQCNPWPPSTRSSLALVVLRCPSGLEPKKQILAVRKGYFRVGKAAGGDSSRADSTEDGHAWTRCLFCPLARAHFHQTSEPGNHYRCPAAPSGRIGRPSKARAGQRCG